MIISKIPVLSKIPKAAVDEPVIYLIAPHFDLSQLSMTKPETAYAKSCIDNEDKLISVNSYYKWIYIVVVSEHNDKATLYETMRNQAFELCQQVIKNKFTCVNIVDLYSEEGIAAAFAEGLILSAYKFNKYFGDKEKKEISLTTVHVVSNKLTDMDVEKLNIVCSSVYVARDIVNEPLSHLNAHKLAVTIQEAGKAAGFEVEVFDKQRIEALRMGGLLAVNRGSVDPPSFSIMTYKPANAINEKPYVIVGKGIVFDTGGLSLKPTQGSMDSMKSDKAGAAAAVGILYAIAKAALPLYVIGLVPATDNRPGENAYAPQDIITMYDGTTVEVLNTDAEGRMILADALAYANKYNPELVIDLATLTGAAVVAVGTIAIAAMGNNKEAISELHISGMQTRERIVELPLWEEYGEQIKSDFADIKNVGGRWAGSITAGKFLEHFTNYPWIHLDIAGTAYLDSIDKYRGKAGTGSGVRLLFDFFTRKCAE